MTYERTAEPGTEPVTLDEAKRHLRISILDTNDDTYITALITVARRLFEYHTGIVPITCNWKLYLDEIPDYCEFKRTNISIVKCPVTAVTFKYYDEDNELKTLVADTDYYADIKSQPARIVLENVPDLYDKPNAVQIEFTAGYATANDVPKEIKQAIMLLIAHLYENRMPVLVSALSYEVPLAYKEIMMAVRV